MKNKRVKVLYIIFFIAAVFFAAFVLVEFRKDYLAVALSAIVMLIAAYFLVDKIERDIYERYDLNKLDIDEKLDEATGEIRRGNEKINRLSEALLHASLQGLSDPKQKLNQFVEDLSSAEHLIEVQKDVMHQQKDKLEETEEFELILRSQQETIALIKAGFKTLIQYSKENARQVALNTNQNSEQLLKELSMTMKQLTDELPRIVGDNLESVQNRFDSLSEAYIENISLVNQRLEILETLLQKITETLQQ
jgi:hypothetical protein